MTDGEQEPKGRLCFDRETFYFSVIISPLDWKLAADYDTETNSYSLTVGPFCFAIGQPFWRNTFESENEFGKVILLEQRRRSDIEYEEE